MGLFFAYGLRQSPVIFVSSNTCIRNVAELSIADNLGIDNAQRRGYFYPSIAFALWHVAPQSVLPNSAAMPGGVAAFTTYALLLGLSHGYFAHKTGSIRWAVVSHCIHDSLGLSGFMFARWLV